MKSQRQEKIIQLIEKYPIDTQEELISKLKENGFEVTQATASRDIRELKLTKILDGHGTYRYVLPKPTNEMSVSSHFNNVLTDSITHIDYALNIIVIKTLPGLAPAVASGIDTISMVDILGCVAGDDTIMVVAKDIDTAREISEKIRDMMKNI